MSLDNWRSGSVNDCDIYGYCEPNDFWHWVDGDLLLTLFVDALILIAIALLIWGVVASIRYFQRPFCRQCRIEGHTTRTKWKDDEGYPICYDHWIEQQMDAEETMFCPMHDTPMEKVVAEDDTIIDVCEHGCVFLEGGELDRIRQRVKDDSTGMSTGLAVGIAVGSAMNSN